MWNTEWHNGHSVGFRRGPLLADLSYGSYGVPTRVHRITISIGIPRHTFLALNYQSSTGDLYDMFKNMIDNWPVWFDKHFDEEYYRAQIEKAESVHMESIL